MMTCTLQLILLLISCIQGLLNTEKSNSFQYIVTNYLQHNNKVNQIVQMVNGNIENEHFNLHNAPIFLIDVQNVTNYQSVASVSRPFFEDPSATLVVLPCLAMIYNNFEAFSKILSIFMPLFTSKRRPKVLITEKLEKNMNYDEFFRFIWSQNFLDITILEFYNRESGAIPINNGAILTRQLFYNPFTDMLYKKKICLNMDLFPDKLTNLHGYPLAVGYFHYPPYVSLHRNQAGQVIHTDGFDVATIKTLAKVRNFTIEEKLSNNTSWDTASCIKEKNEGMFLDLMNKRLQIIGTQSIKSRKCVFDLLIIAENYQIIYYLALVPVSNERSISVVNKLNLLNIVTFFGFMAFVWIIARIFKFDEKNWQLLDILQMSLSWYASSEVKTVIERIIMGSILITCFLLSSAIVSFFTSSSLTIVSSNEIETLDDLYSSSLVSIVKPNMHELITQTTTIKAKNFYNRAIVDTISDAECIEYLIEHKNVTCFMRDIQAKFIVKRMEDKYGQSMVKIVTEYIILCTCGVLLEPTSPYQKSFENVFIKLEEAGMYRQWEGIYINSEISTKADKSQNLTFSVSESNEHIRDSMAYILAVGFVCSILVFIGEILISRGNKVRALRKEKMEKLFKCRIIYIYEDFHKKKTCPIK